MKIKYFAWMKRTVGVAEEDVTPPANVTTVGELVAWLRERSAGHAEALAAGAAFGAGLQGYIGRGAGGAVARGIQGAFLCMRTPARCGRPFAHH